MKRGKHPHHLCDELRIFFIPCSTSHRMQIRVISHSTEAMARELGTNHAHVINDEALPSLDCGCPMALVTNESQMGDTNPRAEVLFDGLPIFGDAFLVGVGQEVKGAHDRIDVDFISLTPDFHSWLGPGHPTPKGQMPWHS